MTAKTTTETTTESIDLFDQFTEDTKHTETSTVGKEAPTVSISTTSQESSDDDSETQTSEESSSKGHYSTGHYSNGSKSNGTKPNRSTRKYVIYPRLWKKLNSYQYIWTTDLKNLSEDIRGEVSSWVWLRYAHLGLQGTEDYPSDVIFDIVKFGDRWTDYKKYRQIREPSYGTTKFNKASKSTKSFKATSTSELIKAVSGANLSRMEISSLLVILSAKMLNL